MKNMMSRTKKIIKHNWQLWILLLPAVIYLILFSYQPMYGVQIAFRDFKIRDGILGSEWVGLEHFKRFLSFQNFWLIMKNTLMLGLYGFATFPVSIALALLLDEVRNAKFKKSVQMLSYMPHFMSTVVIVSMLTLFCDKDSGIINTIIDFLGGVRRDWMTSAGAFRHLYIWSGVWSGAGFGSIIYVSALSGISSELVEAARIDGANRLKIIWHVKIPGILPTVILMLILSTGNIMSVSFEKVFLMQNDLNLSVSQVVETYTYELGIKGGQFSYSSAIGLFNTIINFLILNIVNFIAKKTTDNGLW